MTALEQLAGRHVLFLNWRDPSHPRAGGAETYCYEIARRWAGAGVRVTLLTSRPPGAPPVDHCEGVTIRRGGGTYGVYPVAARHLLRNVHEYDAVVDFQNGIPFFSPAFGHRLPSVCVIHHVHQDQFDLCFDWPLNTVGKVLEKQVSRLVYRGRPIVAVSPSTREEVRRRLGFGNPIYLVPNGAPPSPGLLPPRSDTPAIAVVNRHMPHKRTDLLLRALPGLLSHWPDLHVDIAGEGTELPALRRLARVLALERSVEFHGHVTEERKYELLAGAWLTVLPSRAEGWGLAVIEANAVGTPAVAFDVPGLRDAVQHGRNGWLLPPGAALAQAVHQALGQLSDPGTAARMAERCIGWADNFSWDDSAERLAGVLLSESQRVQRRRRSRRTANDLAVVTHLDGVKGEEGDALERSMTASLRRTDARVRQESGFWLLLHGCDEVLALKVLRRLGVDDLAEVSLAGRGDVLQRFEKVLPWPPPQQPA
jgi:glycosyltransferase involved in cell wall biosynthesis